MQERFMLVSRAHEGPGSDLSILSREEAEKVRAFHRSFPMYAPTPLVSLNDTAGALGLGAVYIKDESWRFGLNAFKVLGGSYAIGSFLAGKLGIPMENAGYSLLVCPETREKLGDITFVTATDGNHGRGVAWAATQFGQKSVVYMPKGSALERLENIRAAGADASITELNYDGAVRLANAHAREYGWTVIQDTAWEGYEEIPTRIMQGYLTMGLEAYEQLPEPPTHIFLQAGVGSLAGAMAGLFSQLYGEKRPVIVIVEPNKADCLFRTARADDGKLHFVTGDMDTIMAGLACGEPCTIAWEILRDYADHFLSCPDYAAAQGMRLLSRPAGNDRSIVSGESGASTFGALSELMTDPRLTDIRDAIGLDSNSRVLCFSTEGATDRANYDAVVNNGKYPKK